MTTNQTSTIVTERVDDIPLLLNQIMQMGIPDILDANFPTHGNWDGLSLGWTTAIWLVHILSQADHRLNRVEDWVAKHIQTISSVTGLPIQASEFKDDRLAIILRDLNQDEAWQEYERYQGKHIIRVYQLPTDIVRLDPTTASSHIEPTEGSLFQKGHSKDHRPDLAQVKIMLASLDPLGLPLATQVVEGNEADDPLYKPAIEQVRRILNQQGVLYVGDCKMDSRIKFLKKNFILESSSIRARIEKADDYYLMPLPATMASNEVLDAYLTPVDSPCPTIEPIYYMNDNGEMWEIAQGFEINETVTGIVSDETISWTERRLVIRSIKYKDAQEKALNKRLKKAKTAIADLTRPRSGYKCITT
jgi:transposase